MLNRISYQIARWRHLVSLHGPRRRLDPGWYLSGTYRSPATGLVIGGASRSGTTLLRVMLDSHPDVVCGPESRLFSCALDETVLARRFQISKRAIRTMEHEERYFPAFVARFFNEYAQRSGATIWAEKTPSNVLYLGWLLERFPQVMFLHLVRDGRAVVNSMRTHPRYTIRRGVRVPTNIERDLDWCIDRWRFMVESGLRFDHDPRVIRISYEDLVASPRETLTPVLARLGLAWHEQMYHRDTVSTPTRDTREFLASENAVDPIDIRIKDRFRHELTAGQIEHIEQRVGDLLVRLGYPVPGMAPNLASQTGK